MTAPTRRRTKAREVALQLLFQFDLRGSAYAEELGQTTASLCAAESEGDAEVQEYCTRIVEGVLARRSQIDQRLQSVARNWDLARMANVDRNILRLSMFELMFCRDVPPKVAINEAIELGKKYSTANSGGFINGILDRVRIDLEQERQKAKAGAPAAGSLAAGAPAAGSPAAPAHPATTKEPGQQGLASDPAGA
jgi:N utilization substance protein B